jgi:cytidine deaminase
VLRVCVALFSAETKLTLKAVLPPHYSDLNPLKPCGACNEWLKKIAEVNPNLRVITFTDAGCRGVHIEQIDD